jgi:hypothetical protein
MDVIKLKVLKQMGFKEVQPRKHEKEFSYDWLRFKKQEHEIDFTQEYNLKGKATLWYVEFNGFKMTGVNTLKQIKLLIKWL